MLGWWNDTDTKRVYGRWHPLLQTATEPATRSGLSARVKAAAPAALHQGMGHVGAAGIGLQALAGGMDGSEAPTKQERP